MLLRKHLTLSEIRCRSSDPRALCERWTPLSLGVVGRGVSAITGLAAARAAALTLGGGGGGGGSHIFRQDDGGCSGTAGYTGAKGRNTGTLTQSNLTPL